MKDNVEVVEFSGDVLQMFKGYEDEAGTVHRDFDIIEMTGEEEEAISKNEIRQNGGKVVRTILERCVTRVGTLTKKDLGLTKWRKVIQDIAVGDQDYMLMKIRELTIGEEIEVVHTCPACKQELKSMLDTSELEFREYSGDPYIEFTLPRGYKDKDGNVHKSGKLRYPNGMDREVLDNVARNNLGVANTMLLTRCMIEFEDLTVHDQIIRKMNLKDREYLVKLLSDNNFGVVLETEVTCTSCGETFKGNFSTSNFI